MLSVPTVVRYSSLKVKTIFNYFIFYSCIYLFHVITNINFTENLLLTKTTETSKIIKHDQLGKYFSALKEGYYLPNEELSIKYPQDAEARQRLLNKF